MRRASRGFGLVEIMVALVLGLVVSLGVIQIFTSSRATFLSQNAAARMQEDARFVLSKMIQELRMTGMYGCLGFTSYVPVSPAIAMPAALDNPIQWTNATSTLTLVTADIGTAGTAPSWTILSDCQTSSQLYEGARAPAAGQTAFPLRQLVYSYSNRTLSLNNQPLLQNISAFNVSFGVAGNPMSYTNAITLVNAGAIRSVRLSLTLTDPDGRVEDQPYSMVAYLRNRF
ncbi:prepilin-type N-terminal cleavage/methylation domain-containing protein [Pseudomonas syringae]|nr:prepilin-type N-terminal cleavage/methylation domain-containing protein [Pseudomonas syringae]MBD8791625.1 prepilin-type N-terminal cleavage/methylation domain-containing protein [Pseudomonas syringae]MBD8802523.1 prepilin-type N-terminal cleavage/methylation domain-containing protein [Pseudomonas syringae]MBD8812983.1 prepilin-type N-terminal cleavage/methylation domain-containing protein [Pseudomonas syringae]